MSEEEDFVFVTITKEPLPKNVKKKCDYYKYCHQKAEWIIKEKLYFGLTFIHYLCTLHAINFMMYMHEVAEGKDCEGDNNE